MNKWKITAIIFIVLFITLVILEFTWVNNFIENYKIELENQATFARQDCTKYCLFNTSYSYSWIENDECYCSGPSDLALPYMIRLDKETGESFEFIRRS